MFHLKKSQDVNSLDVTSESLFDDDFELSLNDAFKEHNLVLIPAPEREKVFSITASKPILSVHSFACFKQSLKHLASQCDIVVLDSHPNEDSRSDCVIALSYVLVCPVRLDY